MYVYGIAIASLYFSKKLNILATIITVVGVSVGQVVALLLQTLQDKNFMVLSDAIVFGVIPRALILIAIATIFTMLSSRTTSLLENLMGAEEQNKMFMRRLRRQEQVNTDKDSLLLHQRFKSYQNKQSMQ